MKKIYLFVFSILFSFSGFAYASVESLLEAPVAQQSYKSAGSSKPTQLPMARTIKQEAMVGKLKEVSKELESQMNQMHQVNLQYQQSTDQKIEALQNQNNALDSKLQKLMQAMMMMNHQLTLLSDSRQSHQTNLPNAKTSHHSVDFSAIFKYVAFGMVALLAVLMGILISRQKKVE